MPNFDLTVVLALLCVALVGNWLFRYLLSVKHISGKAWVVDADDISVNGYRIRMAGIDAPESDQIAIRWNGTTYPSGEVVKRILCKKIGGKHVDVRIDGRDKYKRRVGTVLLDKEDINRWMVAEGLAISAFGAQYKQDEVLAKKNRKGMWGDKTAYDPRRWKHGQRVALWR